MTHAESLWIDDSHYHYAHQVPLLKRGKSNRVSCQATRVLGEIVPALSGVRKGI